MKIFQRWAQGQTGIPIVDACIREIIKTGFTSSKGRQIAANYLTMDLQYDWRWGEAFFREHLIDYDECINLGSWANIAGLGATNFNHFAMNELNNLKKNQPFICSQLNLSFTLDPKGDFIRKWVTELQYVKLQFIHQPWKMPQKKYGKYHLEIGKDYPYPILIQEYNELEQLQDDLSDSKYKKVKVENNMNDYERKIYLKKKMGKNENLKANENQI